MKRARYTQRMTAPTGFTLAEVMVSAAVLAVVMAALITGTAAISGSMSAAKNYSVGQLQVVDYLTLDLRRATSYSFTTAGTRLTLPLNLTLPQFYAADGRTPNPGQRTKVTTANKKKKKKHRVIESRSYYHYGTLGSTVAVQYSLSNGTLFRQEGSLPAREVGRGINRLTFQSTKPELNADPVATLAEIESNPVVTSLVEFNPTLRAKAVPPPLTSTTFLRQYYYSDY